MTTLTKVLIGAAAVTAVAVVTTVVNKKDEQKAIRVSDGKVVKGTVTEDEDGNLEFEEKEGIIKRIKKFVTKKVIRILGWVALHMEQIEAASAIIGFVGTIISITGAVRDFVRNNDLSGKLDAIDKKLTEQEQYYRDEFKALYEDHNILAKNQAKIAKAIGVPVKEEIA